MSLQPPDFSSLEMQWLERAGWSVLNRLGSWGWERINGRWHRRPVDFRTQLRVGLRGENPIVADLSSAVPAISVWFEITNHSDVDVILDRITLAVWAGQPVLEGGVMADRTPIPGQDTVEDLHFRGSLSCAAVERIRQEAARTAPRGSFAVYATAYFDSPRGSFWIRPTKLHREIPGF